MPYRRLKDLLNAETLKTIALSCLWWYWIRSSLLFHISFSKRRKISTFSLMQLIWWKKKSTATRKMWNMSIRFMMSCIAKLYYESRDMILKYLTKLTNKHFRLILRSIINIKLFVQRLLVCFVSLKEGTCETKKNIFYFISKALFLLEVIKF